MNVQADPDPAARVRMRTDGPPVPLHRSEEAQALPPRGEGFLAMTRRRLPWLLTVAAGAVLFGSLLGHALAAGHVAKPAGASNAGIGIGIGIEAPQHRLIRR